MCLAKKSESPQKEAVSPRSPWSKLLNRQNLKPKLPRKVATTTRVNLNKYWSKLGELISNAPPKPDIFAKSDLAEPLVLPFSNFFYPTDPVKPVNIQKENRFELIKEGNEITENEENEVREICYSAIRSDCTVCKICF